MAAEFSRRTLIAAVAAAPAGLAQAADAGRPPAPRAELAFEAIVEIAPLRALGASPLGERRIVPITGGTFEGPRIRGKVLPGGADRQLVRKDGVRMLTATYELETDDGAVIGVVNHVVIDDPPGGPRYAISTIELTAPDGPYGWINKAVYVGTLQSLQPQRQAVRITVYRMV